MNNYTWEAAKALALHNISPKHSTELIQNLLSEGVSIEYFKIPLKEEPFAYLLRICDELQCWDRPPRVDTISSLYLIGDKVRIITKDNRQKLYVNDPDETEKIKDALKGIIEPSIEMWLD